MCQALLWAWVERQRTATLVIVAVWVGEGLNAPGTREQGWAHCKLWGWHRVMAALGPRTYTTLARCSGARHGLHHLSFP